MQYRVHPFQKLSIHNRTLWLMFKVSKNDLLGISVVPGIFVIGSLEFTTGSSSRSLVCVSQR